MDVTEKALRAIIRSALEEAPAGRQDTRGNWSPEVLVAEVDPKGLDMTPEEEILSAIMTRPGGDVFLKRIRDAARAQRGLDRSSPDAVRGWLDAAVSSRGGVKESRESERAAREYLGDRISAARWSRGVGWSNAGFATGLGAVGAMLSAWAAKTGTPLDAFMDSMSYIIPILCGGVAGAEALEALSAGRDVAGIEKVLGGQEKIAAPEKLRMGRGR